MKKFIIILSVIGIALLTLNSCATTGCKGGSCPIWSDTNHPPNLDIKDIKFIDPVIVQYDYDQNPSSIEAVL